MRIALIHNAGSGRRISPASLRELIEREGHELVRMTAHHEGASRIAEPPAELVVAAGGDGTVAEAIRAIAGRDVPLAVLPLGTANNIAHTLQVQGPVEHLARGWDTARRVPFDVGVLHGPGGPQRFVEGAGGGLVEACLSSFARRPLRRGEPAPWQLVRALRRYKQILARLRPRPWALRLDGREHHGEFLLFEVLNTRTVGPNLALGRTADPSDGLLTVVTAHESDRAALAAYIDDRLAGREGALDLECTHARCVDVDDLQTLHVDDALAPMPRDAHASFRVIPGAVTVLVPRPA